MLLAICSRVCAQTYDCEYVDFGDGVHKQPTTISQTDTSFEVTMRDTLLYPDFFERLKGFLPDQRHIVTVDWGVTTIILTDMGEALMFRKCKKVEP
jgi:hypothetical protein